MTPGDPFALTVVFIACGASALLGYIVGGLEAERRILLRTIREIDKRLNKRDGQSADKAA